MQLFIPCISFTFFILYALLIIYYALAWRSVPPYDLACKKMNKDQPAIINGREGTDSERPGIKISVIIPARNEQENIKACLDSILNQNYPSKWYEIIVVDDHSTDKTAAIVSGYSGNIKLISLKETTRVELINSYKKKAIETAIAAASGNLIVTTDADCIAPPAWLQTIASFYVTAGAAFIAMPVAFFSSTAEEQPGTGLLKIFQALDFMTLQGITGASVHKRMHSMCNGANLAYTKKAFSEVDGFKGIDSIASGDDMLLMHKIYRKYPDKIFFLKSKDVIVKTQPVKTIRDFLNQRIRWASKADKYEDKRIFIVLLLVYIFNALLLILPVVCLFRNIQYSLFNIQYSLFQFWVILITAKIIVELFFLYPVAAFFSKRQLLFYFPFMQPFHIAYTIIAGWMGKFGSYQWKGRRVK